MDKKEKMTKETPKPKKEPAVPNAHEILLIKDHIEKDVKKEMKTWIWKPISIFLVIAGIFGYTTYSGIKKLQDNLIENATKNIKKQIGELYSEKNVSAMVDEVIKDDASNLIKEKVNTEVDPIIKRLEEDQKKYARLTSLQELAINAQSGDRKSYDELINISNDPTSKYAEFANRIALKIYVSYERNKASYYGQYFTTAKNEEIPERLNYDSSYWRKIAVDTIKKRRMYDQVPTLISMLKTETNLDVLTAIELALNQLLGTEASFFEEDSHDTFMKAWDSKKKGLLKK